MKTFEPQHPGMLIRHEYLDAHGLSFSDGAQVLGVTRQALNNLVDSRARISSEVAIRLYKAFRGGAETWLFR